MYLGGWVEGLEGGNPALGRWAEGLEEGVIPPKLPSCTRDLGPSLGDDCIIYLIYSFVSIMCHV